LLPTWIGYAGVLGVAGLLGMLAYSAGRFAVTFWRLRPNQPIRVPILEKVAHRVHVRALASSQVVPGAVVRETVELKRSEAKEQLERYLDDYPIETVTSRLALLSYGLTEDSLDRLTRSHEVLRDKKRFAGTEHWLAKFRKEFQKPLDEVAGQRVE